MTDFDGEQAEILLAHPIFMKAVENVRETYKNAWLNSKSDQAEQREELHHRAKALDAVVKEINEMIIRAERVKKHGRSK